MEVSSELATRVLRLVASPDYRPRKPKQIAVLLDLDPEEHRELKRVIKKLVHSGQLAYGSNHLVLPAASPPEAAKAVDRTEPVGMAKRDKVVRGTFRRAVAGFGFVRPGDGSSTGESGEDIFIPPGATGGALDGDTVEIRLRPRSDRRGDTPEGYVDKILHRGRRQFTGTVELKNAVAWVHLDGVPYDLPIQVGDVRGLPVANDDKVFVEIVEFPAEDGSGGEGVLLEVLGKTTNPAIDTLSVMRQYGLPEQFPEEVLAEARRRADEFSEETLPPGRRDLTELLTITIDPFDARDFDDAI